jgi:alpha-N-arabinofuranosidase
MKLSKNICFYTIVLCLFSGNITAQETALIKIDPDRKIDTIDPNIYGAFVEPIRTVVYGNIYDPESPFANENGFRKDFIDLIK